MDLSAQKNWPVKSSHSLKMEKVNVTFKPIIIIIISHKKSIWWRRDFNQHKNLTDHCSIFIFDLFLFFSIQIKLDSNLILICCLAHDFNWMFWDGWEKFPFGYFILFLFFIFVPFNLFACVLFAQDDIRASNQNNCYYQLYQRWWPFRNLYFETDWIAFINIQIYWNFRCGYLTKKKETNIAYKHAFALLVCSNMHVSQSNTLFISIGFFF